MPEFPSESEQEKIDRLRRAMYSRTLSDKLKDRPRRVLDLTQSDVAEDFREPEQGAPREIVAPRGIGVARKVLWWLLGAAILFFIGAVAVFVYYFTIGGGGANASAANIGISISGPQQVQSGEPVELQIAVNNRNSVSLELADLIITYPDGTRSPTDFTTPMPTQRISLGSIESGGTRQGTVKAIFAGTQGQHADIKVELDYHLPNSNAVFTATSDYGIVFASSPLSISVDGNSQTVSGQPMQFMVTVASNASDPVPDVLLNAQYPFGFKFSSASVSDPSVNAQPVTTSDGGSLWQLGTLAAGQQKTVTIQGSLSGEQGDTRIFHFTAGTRNSASSTSITSPLADNTMSVNISQPFLGLAVSVNGATDKTIVVQPGQTVTVAVAWQNNLTTAITNAAIVGRLTGVPIDGSTVKSSGGFYRSTDGVILWDKTTDPTLASLAPGAHGIESFTFTMPDSSALQGMANPSLDISINAAGNRVGQSGVPESLQAATSQKIALASDLQLAAEGLYYTNPFGSTGPMPPKAGTETTYAVVFTVTNTTNTIKDAEVTAQLPPYVRWTGICSPATECDPKAGKLTFDQSAGTLTWHLSDIAPNVGLNGTTPRQMAVAIGFTPSSSQIGQEPVLLQDITLTGTDAATNASITRKAPDVTTNISKDPGFSTANAEVVK